MSLSAVVLIGTCRGRLVLQSGDKFFILDVWGKPDQVSVDPLKPAHLDMGTTAGPPLLLWVCGGLLRWLGTQPPTPL